MKSASEIPNIAFYGPIEAERKIPIIPFNIIHKDKYLHPKFVTKLLNDLFGIQSRAGCSCAGPYGHYLMKIQQTLSDYYRCLITNIGYTGIKPGWVRINLHYAMDEYEVDYLIDAIKFVCRFGYRFLPLYEFNIKTGEWTKLDSQDKPLLHLDISNAYNLEGDTDKQPQDVSQIYALALREAYSLAESLSNEMNYLELDTELMKLMYFYVCNVKEYHQIPKTVISTCKM